MTMEEAITEAHEYFNNYAEIALKHDGTEGTFARTTWRDRPTLMIIE